MIPDSMRKEGKGIWNDKRIIGLIIDDEGSEYAKDLIKDAAEALPQDDSARLIVLAGKHYNPDDPDKNLQEYKRVYNMLHRLEETCAFDGLLVSYGAFADVLMHAGEEGSDSHLLDIPMVFVGEGPKWGIICGCDNEIGIRSAIDFLVKINGCRKMCMLGGREDQADAIVRKKVFRQSLIDNGLEYKEQYFVATDMSDNCVSEAELLLDMNPDVEAVFCVNDSVARAMYKALKKRGLMPGKDVQVFGFDNTRGASIMEPPLSSVGTEGATAGRKIMELLLQKLDGEEVDSVCLPTRLYGRESLKYATYDYSTVELITADEAFIYRMFNDCFYRYGNVRHTRESVDLKRLFYEIMSRVLNAMRSRYMSVEEFNELLLLVDIFIENGVMEYTDTRKFIKCIDLLQEAINQTARSKSVNSMINRVFLRAKDKIIIELSRQNEADAIKWEASRKRIERFCLSTIDYIGMSQADSERIIRNIEGIGLKNAAFYMFDSPVVCGKGQAADFPESIRLRCVVKDGTFYTISRDRQRGLLKEMFSREELTAMDRAFLVLPVLCGSYIYGFLACGLEEDIFDKGVMLSTELGRALYLDEISARSI
ncbi:MAG: LacI family DNA-binding transcriptional regulator [Lachnospiraceae bacterium]|nr:LacI family DNA-binding transcriptional regulator [Lachnospiraceae bacterium]